jgi:hypothetical protein
MTNEDVVRMTGDRLSPDAIVAAIRKAPATRFDLDPEVVIELRRAGVVDAVIEAMRQAQAASAAGEQAAPPPGPSPAGGGSAARVALALRFTAWSDRKPPGPPGKPQVEAPLKSTAGEPLGLAFYLICLDPTHVPDGWTASPLAAGFPRHHLLWLREAAPAETAAAESRLRLELPDELPLEIEPGGHTLQLGLAGRRGNEPWLPLAGGAVRLRHDNASPVTLHVALSGRSGGRRTRTSGYHCLIESVEPAGSAEILREPRFPAGLPPSPP